MHSLLLLPTPRVVRLTGGVARRPSWLHEVVEGRRAELCGGRDINIHGGKVVIEPPRGTDRTAPEHYAILIGRSEGGEATVRIKAHPPAARHAIATLRQIVRQCPREIPCLEIEDAPAFATRGVMVDVSRDRVPTMADLKRTIDLFAELKFNHLQLYTEHTFAYAGHEEAWQGASPITPDEARELDAYCEARGIELCPNQNCFGHLAHWLCLPRYQHLAEIEGDAFWKFLHFERRGPFSLCPTEPAAEAFVRDLLGQLLPCFNSQRVNIGCDETFDVGHGRSRAEVERRAARFGGGEAGLSDACADLYFDFVGRIAAICGEHGRRPMMWADIALSHPELLGRMPEGMIGLAWWYEPTEKFEQWVRVLREHGHGAWVCPGTSSWRSFTGRTTERRANIADAAEQGARAGATGFMVCDWGDLGHRQQWPIALAGIAQAAEAAWNPARARVFDARVASLHVFDDPTLRLGPWLDELGDADLAVRKAAKITNASGLFNDLHPPAPGALVPGKRAVEAPAEAWAEVSAKLDYLAARRPRVNDATVNRDIEHTLDVAGFAADHGRGMREGSGLQSSWKRAMADRMGRIIEEHRALWLTRSRPGGLEHSCSYYERVIEELLGHGKHG